MTRAPDPATAALAAAALEIDPARLVWTCLSGQAHRNAVWRAAGPDARAIVKRHAHPRGYAQERAAYLEWLPRLPPGLTPALLAHDDPTRTLVLADAAAPDTAPPAPHDAPAPSARRTAPPAPRDASPRPLTDMSPGTSHARPAADDPLARPAAHAAAGRFLRALHDLDLPDRDPLPLVAAMTTRLRAWDERAGDVLRPPERAALRRLAARVDAFAGARRVPCHRDFTPDNWMSSRTGVVVLDFEHACLDAAEFDLVKLRADLWTARPELAAAFLADYGPLDADADARLDVLLALHATATLAWARRHGDAQFQALGARALAAALARA